MSLACESTNHPFPFGDEILWQNHDNTHFKAHFPSWTALFALLLLSTTTLST
jgi:hypothetical protein